MVVNEKCSKHVGYLMAIFSDNVFHLTVVNKGFGWTAQPLLSDLFHGTCYHHV
jgi:hypothetical protein